MRRQAWLRVMALAMLGVFFVPLTAQDEALGFNVLSANQEAAMGREEFEKYKKSKKIVGSGSQHAMTQRVASRLTRIVSVPNAQWEFVLFDDATPNAFALPGGKVGIHTGMFKVVENEAQLAAVLGHELGHITARHSGKRISNAAVGSLIGVLGGKILEKRTGMSGEKAQGVAQGAATLRLLQYSRKQELESDRLGATYMARAGYDPQESVRLWERFAQYKAKQGGAAPPAFLSTHPLDSRRIEDLQAYLPVAQREYRASSSAGTPAPAAPSSNPPKALRVRP